MFVYGDEGLEIVAGEHISVYTLIHGPCQGGSDLAGGCKDGNRAWTGGAKVEGGAQDEPDGEGEPFGLGEVAGERGNKFHNQQESSDKDAERGKSAGAEASFDEKKGHAGC